ncbi:MAG: cytochrome d ubiquinol oxidase subunit II [Ignavibacteriae bacterium]|nr:cytochrome d ubiquinol oxidase subunit II [Ignavibacteriota bacterium]MCB9243303.1 cytochrome d ubiquinol oxidase subunit II [Ignavibacteriales bacterium]
MLEVVIIFLGLSLLLYVLFGGADFGGGIIELVFARRIKEPQKLIIDRAIAPVWEANHMWLIIVVVILFVGFPAVYSTMLTYLHLPVTALLVGIVIRGTAFTFRHYDAIKDNSQKYYELLFKLSSLWTSFFLGVTMGAMVYGRIDPDGTSFVKQFVSPWFNPFCISIGIFTCCIFAFLAAVYLIGESDDDESRKVFIKIGKVLNLLTVITGGTVFLTGRNNSFHLLEMFLNSTFALECIALATLSLPVLWIALKNGKGLIARLTAGFQILMIMLAWYAVNFPIVLNVNNTSYITLTENTAPQSTLTILALALLFGSLFILPFLFYLLRVFKLNRTGK